MTERLRDLVATDDPALAELARLVRAAGDPGPRPGAQDRVRRALAGRPPGRRWHRWQAAAVAALVVFIVLPAAIAGVRWIVASPVSPSVPAVPAPVPPPAAGSPRVAHRSAAAAEPEAPASVPVPASAGSGAPVPRPAPEAPVTPGPVPPARGPTAMPPPASERRPHLPGRATAPVDDAPAAAAAIRARESSPVPIEPGVASAPAADDTALVIEAMRRLRRGHDPRAALRELDAYLSRFPDGDLAEEVLALAIEARAALGDAAACSLAEQYLQRYPHGRFRDPAERIRLQLRDPDLQRCPSR
ncbi:MAG TPA: hypothetical protein VHW23_39110 [Kofleriaceae bacterium]|jgi:hypothetical protein|nr:hypothetical protein [Kofleriaceae bacterium]